MAEKKIGILGYNYENDRYGILNNMDLWEDDGLHCGAGFEVWDNKTETWIADRLEMSHNTNEWYLVESKLKGDELEHLRIRY